MNDEGNSDRRVERVVFETDHHVVVGDMTLPPADGYQSRFSDVMNRSEFPFIPLVNVEIAQRGGVANSQPFLLLGKSHIQLAYPAAGDGA